MNVKRRRKFRVAEIMTSNNSVEQAKELLSGCLFIPVESIKDNSDITALGELDSLTFEMIVMEIEKHIKREVDPVKLLEMQSVKDLALMLEK